MQIVIPKSLDGVGAGRSALVTGIYGQDGSYMVDLLLALGYDRVWGAARKVSMRDDQNIRHNLGHERFELLEMDLQDPISVDSTIKKVWPDELYNFGALSRVGASFNQEVAYLKTNALGPLYLIKAIQKFCPECRMYQASTTELYGGSPAPHGYDSPFSPDSPYATSKLAAHWQCINESRAGGGFFVPCILTNHESPRRGRYFVTQKIIYGMLEIARLHAAGADWKPLGLGNLTARRDWTYAPEMVFLAWLALQQDDPSPLIAGSGVSITVEDFLVRAARACGIQGVPDRVEGAEDAWALGSDIGVIARVDQKFYRPMAPSHLEIAESAVLETYKRTGWKPWTTVDMLITKMVDAARGCDETIKFAPADWVAP